MHFVKNTRVVTLISIGAEKSVALNCHSYSFFVVKKSATRRIFAVRITAFDYAIDIVVQVKLSQYFVAEKQINQLKELIEKKKEEFAQAEEKHGERKNHLKHKKEELDAILAETQKEEDLLLKKSAEFEKKVEERLVAAYKRIRSSVRNGLAVVPIERGASAGSFFTIPPQLQLEIASRKKIITDEHSGRILVDAELAQEEQEKIQALFSS